MNTKSIILALAVSCSLLGCGAGEEAARGRDVSQLLEAPASLQRQGVARYTSDTVGDAAELTLLSDRGEVLGALSAVKDVAHEALEVTLTLPRHDLTFSKSKAGAVLTLNGRPASSPDAATELEMARDLLTEEGFLPRAEGPARAESAPGLAPESLASFPGSENAYCGPERGGCYRSSNQAWACFKAKPSCLAGYCSQSACSCYDDTKWYDLYHVYVCCASASCN